MLGMLAIIVVLSFFSVLQARKNPGQVPSVAGFKVMSVLTGSMRPTIQPGDLIISKNVEESEIQKGDIITYKASDQTLVTHRVEEVVRNNRQQMYRTKGDANNVEDQNLVSREEVVGSYLFRIPKGGYLVQFLQSPIGFVSLILLPIILLIRGEFKTLQSDWGKKKEHNI